MIILPSSSIQPNLVKSNPMDVAEWVWTFRITFMVTGFCVQAFSTQIKFVGFYAYDSINTYTHKQTE